MNQKGFPFLITICPCHIVIAVIFLFEKRVRRVKVDGTGANSSLSQLLLHDTIFNLFYICFPRASEMRFLRLQETLKCKLISAKDDYDHSQTVGRGKKLTVMSTCSFMAKKKTEFLPLFSESSPALKNSCHRSRILGNYEVEKSKVFVDTKPSAQCLFWKLTFGNSSEKTCKSTYQIFLAPSSFTGFLYFIPNILSVIVKVAT